MTFDELNLNRAIRTALDDLEYVYPTPIQEQAFSVIMSGKNVVGVAQTGTGKTFAYLLPIIRMLTFSKQRDPRVLIIAPTHELVIQIIEEIKKLTKYSELRSLGIYGGANINKQKQAVYDGTDILVATPGRLIDLTYTGVLSLKSIQKLVIDEVDEMLSLGFRTQLNTMIGMLPKKRQNLMFSATLTDEIEALIKQSIPNANKIEVAAHGTPLDKIIQIGYHVPNFNTKVNLLELLLNEDEELNKVLVFVGSKKFADRLFEHMNPKFLDQISVIHSNKAHNTRMNAVRNFQDGTHRLIIATDIIARGMDISDVSHIINFDMSELPGDYIHRIGRTGRADKAGVAISFINEVEQEYQLQIEELMGKEIPMKDLPSNLVISNIFSDEDKPKENIEKKYHHGPSINNSQGAFHEKSEKNKKINSGSASRHKDTFKKSGKRIKNKRSGRKR